MIYTKLKNSSPDISKPETEELFVNDVLDLPKNTTKKSFFLLFKAFIGTGVLFLPRGFAKAGLVPSIIMMGASAYLSALGMLFLGEVAIIHSGTYWEIGGKLYGTRTRSCILWSIFLSQIGFSMAYILFIAQNCLDLIQFFSDCKLQHVDNLLLIMPQLLIYIPLCFLKDLKMLSKTMIIASALIVYGCFYIIWNSAFHMVDNGVRLVLATD
eukprot:NODE_92_length_21543_cov_0.719036.p7 type:complete len:212 gc:universal NODE_92_length_21543_cov_0.719036:11974-11339(-)